MLRAAGERGVTNAELWDVAHAAHSRIAELRALGHRIRCVREAPGLYASVYNHIRGEKVLDFAASGRKGHKLVPLETVLRIERAHLRVLR